MDAHLYPAASAFEQPKRLPQILSTRTSSIAELKEDPEAMAFLKEALPGIATMTEGPIAIVFEAMSLRNAVVFGRVTQDAVDRIEARFTEINARRGLCR